MDRNTDTNLTLDELIEREVKGRPFEIPAHNIRHRSDLLRRLSFIEASWAQGSTATNLWANWANWANWVNLVNWANWANWANYCVPPDSELQQSVGGDQQC